MKGLSHSESVRSRKKKRKAALPWRCFAQRKQENLNASCHNVDCASKHHLGMRSSALGWKHLISSCMRYSQALMCQRGSTRLHCASLPGFSFFFLLVVARKTRSYDSVNVPRDNNKTYMPVAFKVSRERVDRNSNLLQVTAGLVVLLVTELEDVTRGSGRNKRKNKITQALMTIPGLLPHLIYSVLKTRTSSENHCQDHRQHRHIFFLVHHDSSFWLL